MILWLALAASVATFVGGSFALKFRDQLHLILGFSAGAVAGVALFDLLPEAMTLGAGYHAPATIALAVAAGFFGYLILDRLVLLHSHGEEFGGGDVRRPTPDVGRQTSHTWARGAFGALTLSAHSLLDGMAIGIGYQASVAVGAVVTAAVLTHDFSDGINTVNVVLKSGGRWGSAFRWLLVDAAAPLLGAAATLFFVIPPSTIGLVLAAFVGSFLYLSASDLIPESHHRHPRALTTVMTLAGAALIYAIVHLV